MATIEEMVATILAKMDANTARIVEMNRLLGEIHDSAVDLMDGNDADQECELCVPASFPNCTPATASAEAPTSSPTSATDADPGFPLGVTKLADPLVSIDVHLGILFDADGAAIDHLSRLPDSLLRNIVYRLPIKDAARTAVLSRRWSPIWRPAPPLVNHTDIAALQLNPKLVTAAWASPAPSLTSSPCPDAVLDFQLGVTKLLVMPHTKYSTPRPSPL